MEIENEIESGIWIESAIERGRYRDREVERENKIYGDIKSEMDSEIERLRYGEGLGRWTSREGNTERRNRDQNI